MPDLDVILNRLREAAADDFIHQKPYVPLAAAESAVREARDATVQEIVDALRNFGWLEDDAYADFVARRFPNGGTDA